MNIKLPQISFYKLLRSRAAWRVAAIDLRAKLLAMLFVLASLSSAGASVSFVPDSSTVNQRQFDKAAIKNYQGDRDFKYRDASPQESGIMEMIVYYLSKIFGKAFSTRVGETSIYELLLYGLMIFGAGMIIFQFLKIKPQSMMSRSAANIAVSSLEVENIHEIDFDKLIEQSAAQQNYRLAVRFWYLKMLKVMSDAQLINWQISKTNYDYYYELKQQTMRHEFLSLTNTFEDSWYGNNNLSDARYEQATQAFRSFFNRLKP